MPLSDEEAKRVRNTAENYTTSVHALLAFSAFVVHDGTSRRAGSHFGLGRRMTTSKQNTIAPNADVTPDLVAQSDSSYGIVAEMKKSLPADQSKWSIVVQQLQKYDDQLSGWWSADARLPNTDAALLIHRSRSRAFVEYLEEYQKTNGTVLGAHTSVIEFVRSVEAAHYFAFRLEFGHLSHADLSQLLHLGVDVPIEKVLRSFPTVKYYDAEPPLPLLLTDLWTDSFAKRAADVAADENGKTKRIEVDVAELATEMQRAYGSRARGLDCDDRSAEFPRIATIRKALDALVKARLAIPTTSGRYQILYRRFRKTEDVLLRFGEILGTAADVVEPIELAPPPPQTSLFDLIPTPLTAKRKHAGGTPSNRRRRKRQNLGSASVETNHATSSQGSEEPDSQ